MKTTKNIILGVFIFSLIIFGGSYEYITNKAYNDAIIALENNSKEIAYKKIKLVKNIRPNYKDTKATYNKAKAYYYIELVYNAINSKDYKLAWKYIEQADTGFYAKDIINGYYAYITYYANLNYATNYFKKGDFDNALKAIAKSKEQKFNILLEQKLIKLNDEKGNPLTYTILQNQLKQFEKEIKNAIAKRQKRFNYLKSQIEVNKEDLVENQKILIHRKNFLSNYLDTFTLVIETKDEEIRHLLLYINYPCRKEEYIYLEKVLFNIDGKKEEIILPEAQIIRRQLPIPAYFRNVIFLTECVFLNEEYLGDKIYSLTNNIAKSKVTYIKLQGQKDIFQREITSEEKEILSEMYEYYYYRKYFNMK